MLDGFGFLLNRLLLESGYARTAVCILGVLLTSLSVAMFFRTYISPCGYDQFVKVVSAHFKIKIDKFKIGYDLTSLAVSIALTLILFKKIEGIGAVTVICAFINGILISGFGRLIDRKVSFYNRFGFDKYF